MKILFGTRNRGKIRELLDLLAHLSNIEWLTFEDVSFSDVLEDGQNFKQNALKKARQIALETGIVVLAEDSGLEVDALDGEPGIHTARYAGENATSAENIHKLLSKLDKTSDRSARFRCHAVLLKPQSEEIWHSEGVLEGSVAYEPKGDGGFGYDPIFIPSGHSMTLAQLGDEIKRSISHRKHAIEPLAPVISALAQTP